MKNNPWQVKNYYIDLFAAANFNTFTEQCITVDKVIVFFM